MPVNLQTELLYRFPNGEIQHKRGVFRLVDQPSIFEGFIVSNFEGTACYGFFENEIGEEEAILEKPIVISESAYIDLAFEFIHYLQDNSIGKAILSRIKVVDFKDGDNKLLFHQLLEAYPNTFCYTFKSPLLGTWIGATPEILVDISSGNGKTMSLAGTKPTTDQSDWGQKELQEQQMVTDFISKQLENSTSEKLVSERQELVAGPVKHLVHYFDFKIEPDQQWNLIQKLHPTPAVSGFPRDKALTCISNFEPHERELYAGIIGFKSTERTQLYVNLRSARIDATKIYLFVGGGLTQKSVPQDEWLETENKSKTIAKFL